MIELSGGSNTTTTTLTATKQKKVTQNKKLSIKFIKTF